MANQNDRSWKKYNAALVEQYRAEERHALHNSAWTALVLAAKQRDARIAYKAVA